MIGNGMTLETPEIAQGVKTNPDGSTPSAEGRTPASGQFYESGATSRNGASAGHGGPASSGFAKALRLADWSGVKDKRTETLLGSFQAGATASRLMPDGPPPMAVAGLLPPRGTKSLLVGPSGVGKTHLALELSACLADKRPFAGLELDPDQSGGAVLYLAAEDYDGVFWRLGALTSGGHLSVEAPVVAANLAGFRLTDAADVDRIISAIAAMGDALEIHLDAVIVDHLTACAGESLDGDAAAEAIMGALQRIATECWVSVLALHHTGKDQSRGARGSQVLYDRADAVLQVREGRGGLRRLYVDKLRNGAKAPEQWFRLAPLPGPFAAVRVEFVDGEPQQTDTTLTPRQTAALIALQAAGVDDGITDTAAKAAIRSATVFAALEGDAQRKAVQRALDDLESVGQLARDGENWRAAA